MKTVLATSYLNLLAYQVTYIRLQIYLGYFRHIKVETLVEPLLKCKNLQIAMPRFALRKYDTKWPRPTCKKQFSVHY